jgi:hypothetical protein
VVHIMATTNQNGHKSSSYAKQVNLKSKNAGIKNYSLSTIQRNANELCVYIFRGALTKTRR